MRLLEGIVNTCRLFRRPRVALAMLRTQPRHFLAVLAGKVDVHLNV
jgi:hypothetical protein